MADWNHLPALLQALWTNRMNYIESQGCWPCVLLTALFQLPTWEGASRSAFAHNTVACVGSHPDQTCCSMETGRGGGSMGKTILFIYLPFGLTFAVCHNKAFALFGSRPRTPPTLVIPVGKSPQRHHRGHQSRVLNSQINSTVNSQTSIFKTIQP